MARKTKRLGRKSANLFVPGGAAGNLEKDFDPDYSYIKKDLRRIGILAGSFFALLIVLSFFLG